MKAQIVIDSQRGGFKAIVEHEKSKCRFFPSHPNTKKEVHVKKADKERLWTALFAIGVRLLVERYEENIEFIAERFKQELCTDTNLCWNEVDNDGFYQIIAEGDN